MHKAFEYEEYEICLVGLNRILKEAWTKSQTDDNIKSDKIKALGLAKECYAMKLNQLDLLRSIGTFEMEKEFEGRVKYLEEVHRIAEFPERSKIEEEIEVENVKKILHEST
jgi:hypothetical protein